MGIKNFLASLKIAFLASHAPRKTGTQDVEKELPPSLTLSSSDEKDSSFQTSSSQGQRLRAELILAAPKDLSLVPTDDVDDHPAAWGMELVGGAQIGPVEKPGIIPDSPTLVGDLLVSPSKSSSSKIPFPSPVSTLCTSPLRCLSTTPRRELRTQDLLPVRTLGRGGQGMVALVYDRVTGSQFALKVVKKDGLHLRNYPRIFEEQDIMKKLSGIPWLLPLEGSFHDSDNFYFLTVSIVSSSRSVIIELMMLRSEILSGGDLMSEIWRLEKLPVSHCRVGHPPRQPHRASRSKPENILIDEDDHVVLADFGISKAFGRTTSDQPWTRSSLWSRGADAEAPDGTAEGDFTGSLCGTTGYIAPEVYSGHYTYDADIWGAGVILYQMLLGRLPFGLKPKEQGLVELLDRTDNLPVDFDVNGDLDADVQDLLERMLEKHPDRRPSIEEIKTHAWLKDIDWERVHRRDKAERKIIVAADDDYFEECCGIPYGLPYAPNEEEFPWFQWTSPSLQASSATATSAYRESVAYSDDTSGAVECVAYSEECSEQSTSSNESREYAENTSDTECCYGKWVRSFSVVQWFKNWLKRKGRCSWRAGSINFICALWLFPDHMFPNPCSLIIVPTCVMSSLISDMASIYRRFSMILIPLTKEALWYFSGHTMEAFQLLSRGGAKFDKQRFKTDVQLFNGKSKKDNKGKAVAKDADGDLPAELDFFKYAQGGPAKRKASSGNVVEDVGEGSHKGKKLRLEDDGDDDQQGSDDEPPMPRHRVTTKGNNVPAHADSFEALKERYHISSHLLANLAQHGYKRPTGIQSYGIPILMEMWTVAGPCCYLSDRYWKDSIIPPASHVIVRCTCVQLEERLWKGVRAIILAPTRELAHQIHNECLKLAQGRKWRIVLFSKATASTLADRNARDKVDIIISTPLRLVATLQAGNLELNNVRHLILDEADRMLDAEFLHQAREIVASCTHANVQKAVFSATLPAGVEKTALSMLRDPIRVVVGLKDTPLPLIAQSLTYVADDQSKLPTLLQYLSQPYNPPVLVFVSSQPRASSLAEELVLGGVPNVDCLHAGMSRKEREDAVSRMRRGESWVMVSTEVMARGMDFKGVREVINYDFPQSVQSYVHRIGRTGRAGREGKAVTYFTDADGPFLKTIANVLLQSGSPVPEWILKLPKPSKMKRREMGKVKRAEAVNDARRVGRSDAIKKRDMIAGSKRRKEKEEQRKQEVEGVESAEDDDNN
ncbi:DEAD-box ATP-dependent RNA helicase 57 [Grifola frondosa]|uniref:RNA helicase n=1 Tax=Grifola frondosa TaxID=5627 RepID=A0A1C7MXI3_GRIFR|nr:DEAD-box ATP-dependent RNA helicase 57 [Grifola frondosa]